MRKEKFEIGERYHVYNRGTGQMTIFYDDSDRERFAECLHRYLLDRRHEERVQISAYVLMPNHFHLLLQQRIDGGIGGYMNKVCQAYAMYFNRKYGRSGCVFSGRFKAKHVVTDAYLLHLSRYIHRNPEPLLEPHERLEDYKWSSYLCYLGMVDDPLVKDRVVIEAFHTPDEYRQFVHLWKLGEDVLITDVLVD